MASRRGRKNETCAHEDCGSRRFHIGDDGFTYCDQGHQQSERGTVISQDTGELMLLGKTSRKKDSDAESATSRASSLSGSHAFEHYLLCVQLVLRKQLYWLLNQQKMPAELETLVKDLWALRLQKVQSRIAYESETDTEAASSQMFSSQSESEVTSASRSTRKSRRRQEKGKVQEGPPSLVETLALCHIGMLYLRLPVSTAEVLRWTNDGHLLYYRANREVPLGMRDRLPPRYQALLEPQDILSGAQLHAAVFKTLQNFHLEFGMSPPALNLPLIRYRLIAELMLPLEIYAATDRLARLLDIDFLLDFTSKAWRINCLHHPEARLVAVLVVATKLLFPFDALQRHTGSDGDLSAIALDWKEWNKQEQARRQSATSGGPAYRDLFKFNEAECFSSSDKQLDAYLDWYEDNIASEDIRERGKAGRDAELRRAMFGMFPTHERHSPEAAARMTDSNRSTSADRVRAVQSKLQPRPTFATQPPEDETSPVGSVYKRIRDKRELSGVAKHFYERAAELAGLSLDEMVQAVFAVEKKMQKVEERLRKGAA